MTDLIRLLRRTPPPPIDVELEGRTCVVTGATSGIGKEIARGLLRLGADVVLACRSEAKGRAAVAELTRATGNAKAELMLVDMADQGSIHGFAAKLLASREQVHVLVNNAGIYPAERRLSPDGIELTWATNVMGYFLLTNLLEARLVASAPARVVNVASLKAGGLDMGDAFFERRSFDGVVAYKQSKQANRMLAWARADRLEGTGLTVNVAEPGPVKTSIGAGQKGAWGLVVGLAFSLAPGVEVGADTPLWLACAPELEAVSGGFWGRRQRHERPYYDVTKCAELVALCEGLLQSTFDKAP